MGHYDRNLEILSKNVDAFFHSKYWLFKILVNYYSIQFTYFVSVKNGMHLNQIFDNLTGMNA